MELKFAASQNRAARSLPETIPLRWNGSNQHDWTAANPTEFRSDFRIERVRLNMIVPDYDEQAAAPAADQRRAEED